jgi:hypothetical protein
MKMKYIPIATFAVIALGWGIFAYYPNNTFSEATHSSPHDGADQVYLNTGNIDPITLDCAVIELSETPLAQDVSDALAEASKLALKGCVSIRWMRGS